MTKTIQLLRGTTAQNDAFTGAAGEVTVDTQTHELRVHDGSTVGGFAIPKKSDVQSLLGGGTAGTLLTNSGTPGTVNSTSIDATPTDGSNNPVSSNGVYDELSGKANTDMSNLSRVETQIINNFGMPDYTAGGSRSVNISYTESENGYLVVTPSLQSGNSELNIEIEGQNFQFWQGFDGVDYNHLNIGVFPIPRNVTYIITRWQNVNVKFFPCIGG